LSNFVVHRLIFGGEGGSFHAPLSRALYLEAAAGEIQGVSRCGGAVRCDVYESPAR